MKSAAEIAASYLAKQLSLFDAARQLHAHIADPRSALWQALEGSHGPLPVIYVARDEAERLGFFVSNEVQWERKAFEARNTELVETELRLAPDFGKACEAIIRYAQNSN
jgi:hypothetical protein